MRWVLLFLALGACASARKRADVTFVRDIQFEGTGRALVGPRTDHALREQMAQPQSPPLILTWPFTLFLEGPPFRPDVLGGDEERVETWLAHHGWFDADLTWYIDEKRKDRRRRAGVVDVTGKVTLGAPTRWEDAPAFTWVGDAPLSPATVRALSMVHADRRFSLEDLDATGAALERALGDEGHPWPTVTFDVEVRPEVHAATVAFAVDPGPKATVGPITVSGVTLHDPRVIADVAGLREGDPWRTSEVDAAREALYGTAAFDRVVVAPTPDPGAVAPVAITLEPARPRQLAVGGQLGWQGPFFKPEIHASWSTTNARNRLAQTRIGLATGFGYTPARSVLLVRADWERLTHRFAGLPIDWTLDFGVRSDIYEYLLPRTDATVRTGWAAHPTRAVTLTFGPQLGWTRLGLPETAADETAITAALGPGFNNQYGLAQLAGALTLDGTHPRAERKTGLWGRVFTASVLPIGVSSPFQRVEVDLRAYDAPLRPVLGKPLQLLGRATARSLVGAADDLPYPERLFLGGASQFRGFRAGQVGAYDCVCVPRPWARVGQGAEGEIQRYYLPQGGTASAMLGGEAQLHHVGLDALTASVFAEAGALGPGLESLVDPARWRFTVGAGVRYETPIGPFRLDVSTRPIAPEDAGPGGPAGGAYLGCDAYGPRRRAFDVLSEFGRFGPLERSFPAINVFVTIGEAM